MLEISDAYIGYGDTTVVYGSSITVPEDSIVAVLGRNGVGKTTLLRGIMGQNTISEGEIVFEGTDIVNQPPYEIAAAGVALVPQSRDIFSILSVEDNIRMGSASSSERLLSGVDDEIYDYFPMLEQKADARGGTLSGGQQQQLAIARALNSDPKLLLLDEPSEGIQPSIVDDIRHRIKQIKTERNISVLIVEQNLNLALDLAEYCYIMEAGRVVEHGEPDELQQENKITENIEI